MTPELGAGARSLWKMSHATKEPGLDLGGIKKPEKAGKQDPTEKIFWSLPCLHFGGWIGEKQDWRQGSHKGCWYHHLSERGCSQ